MAYTVDQIVRDVIRIKIQDDIDGHIRDIVKRKTSEQIDNVFMGTTTIDNNTPSPTLTFESYRRAMAPIIAQRKQLEQQASDIVKDMFDIEVPGKFAIRFLHETFGTEMPLPLPSRRL